MIYQTYLPHPDLASLVKCYWTLENRLEQPDIEWVINNSAKEDNEPLVPKQRILPDGCLEMIFILGDDIRRYTSENEWILQPRAFILGQILEPFFVQPTGCVDSFAVRFYPYAFANLVPVQLNHLANTETPLHLLFGNQPANLLTNAITLASGVQERIQIVEDFLTERFTQRITVDNILQSAVESLFSTNGSAVIKKILRNTPSQRRQLERKFAAKIGLSPKQLGRIIRLQTALSLLLSKDPGKLTAIAYESDYFDQAHFIKDFKAFTGVSPSAFAKDKQMTLSSLIYSPD